MATGSGKTLAAARSAVEWTRGLEKVTVHATYAGLEAGTLERAHAAGLPGWILLVSPPRERPRASSGR